VLEYHVSRPHLVVALLDGGDVASLRGDPSLPADGFDGIDDGLVGCFAAACKLLAGMDVVAKRVDDVAAAGADAKASRAPGSARRGTGKTTPPAPLI
jgi:hypothetical protein